MMFFDAKILISGPQRTVQNKKTKAVRDPFNERAICSVNHRLIKKEAILCLLSPLLSRNHTEP